MESNNEKRPPYEKPKVLASYQKEELEAIIQPHGDGIGDACSRGGSGPKEDQRLWHFPKRF